MQPVRSGRSTTFALLFALLLCVLVGCVPPTPPAADSPAVDSPGVDSPAVESPAGASSGPDSSVPASSPPASAEPDASATESPVPDEAEFSLLQMNVCLSGQSGCFPDTEYPAVVEETVARILEDDVDAVTLNEACRDDVAGIAQRTGYNYHFVPVRYAGALLPCEDPGDRGLFGIAVLSKTPVRFSGSGIFPLYDDIEERRWMCVTTARRVDVCTSHLSPVGGETGQTNSQQCAALSDVLAARTNPTVFAGDVNRHASCAPPGFWTVTDAEASQAEGIQHAYGSLPAPSVEVEATTYTDHDAMVVRTRLPRR